MIIRSLTVFLLFTSLLGVAGSYPANIIKGMIITQGLINGQPVNVILDSGAPGIVLNEKYYQGDPSSAIPCSGVNGSFTCRTETIQSWDWLGLHGSKTKALVSDLSFLEYPASQPIHAIIGLNVLNDFYVSIDFDQQRITLMEDAPETMEASAMKFFYAGHLPVIPCRINGQKKLLGLDTGSAANYLFDFDVKANHPDVTHAAPVVVVGTGNKEDIKHRVLLDLEVAEGELPTPASFIVDLDKGNEVDPIGFHGILGQEFLAQYNLIIHPGKQRLLLLPRANNDLVVE